MAAVAPILEAHRQIGDAKSEHEGLSGRGLIKKLSELERPVLALQKDKERFAQISKFVQSVTGYSDAYLEVPRAEPALLVHMGGKLLPVESLGTGIHQVILFAVAATVTENSIMCIEEPEIHLHPRLQKELLTYLRKTSNQYFITTHSAHILDAQDAAIFHVGLNEHQESVVEYLRGPSHRASICFDLGYRPSDLVQANSIIWVEGPSDRIYVKAWIESVATNFVEGTHYSIMFYGGKLLSHLTATDEDITNFIDLLRLNRNVMILMDSDRGKKNDSISATKERVANKVGKHGGLAWITAGREIENYLTPETLKTSLSAVHPTWEFSPPKNEWTCCYKEKTSKDKKVDKIRLAREATKSVDLTRLDLKERIDELIAFIRKHNN